MDYFDKSLKEYYESLNHRLGKSKIKFSHPVLFDFIAAIIRRDTLRISRKTRDS